MKQQSLVKCNSFRIMLGLLSVFRPILLRDFSSLPFSIWVVLVGRISLYTRFSIQTCSPFIQDLIEHKTFSHDVSVNIPL